MFHAATLAQTGPFVKPNEAGFWPCRGECSGSSSFEPISESGGVSIMQMKTIERRSRHKISKTLLLGLILLVPSLYSIFLMVREQWLSNAVNSRYSITECFEGGPNQTEFSEIPLSYIWYGQKVVFSDDFEKGNFLPDDRRAGRVKITINGKDYTSPWLVEIRPNDHNVNRYFKQVMLVKFDDKALHTERLVVLQSFPDFDLHEYNALHPDTLRCRALFIDSGGKVTEQVFPFSERSSPLYCTLLAGEVAPEQLGFYSQALELWPSVFYPLLYPLVSVVMGLIITIIGLARHRQAHKAI